MKGKYKTIKSFRKEIVPEGIEAPVNEPKEYILSMSEFDENNNEVKQVSYHTDGSIEQFSECMYDINGNLIEEKLYYENNELADHRKFERDEKGVVLREIVYYNDETFDTIVYKYDSDLNLIEKATVNTDGDIDDKEVFVYAQGNITLHTVLDSNNHKVSESSYTYDGNGKVLEMTDWDSETDKKYKTVNSYNEKGILIKQLRYLKDNLIAKLVFELDENDKVIEVLDEDTRHKNTLKIIHDEKGNVIEEAEYDRNELLNHSIMRTFNENNDILESIVFIDHRSDGFQENYRLRYQYV